MKEKICSIKINFVILAIWGVVMSFIIPTWQTPDEQAHLKMIGTSLHNEQMADLIYSDMKLSRPKIQFHSEVKVNKEEWKEAITKKPSYNWKECMPKGISLSVITHLPATIGLLGGVALHLPTFWVMELAELFALAFYLLVCYLAIGLMPVKKEVLLLVMALPMTMQQASCINYDSVLMPLSFLLIAYTMHLYYTEDKITWKNLLIWAGILLLIAYVKLPYILFGVMFFGLPFDKFSVQFGKWTMDGEWIHKYCWLLRALIVVGICAGYYLVRNNDYVVLATVMCQEARQTLHLIENSILTFKDYYAISLVGCFGWIDSQIPRFLEILIYGLMPVLVLVAWLNKKSEFPRKRQIIYLILTFLLLGFFITISMVNHTITVLLFGEEQPFGSYDVRSAIYSIPYIGGLQGRYYIPFLPLPLLAIGKANREENSFAMNGVMIVYTLIAAVTTVFVLYGRYWA